MFFKNVLKSSQFSRFLCVIATRGSPLILVSTNLYNTCEFSGLITANAVSTFEINANTSLLSPLNGVINIRSSLADIYCHDFIPMLLLSFKRSALYGARLTKRKIRVTAACGVALLFSVLSGWLLPLVLLPFAAGWCPVSAAGCCSSFCCPVSAAGCCPSFCCTWWLAAASFLRLAAAPPSAALGRWLLPRPCCWLLHLTAAAAPSLRLAATPCSPSQGRSGSLLSAHSVDRRIENRPPLTCVLSRAIVER